jgi:hypothetical protein
VVWLLAMTLSGGLARGQETARPASLTNDAALALLTNDFKIPLWNETIDLRGTIGYNDNVQLANTNRQGSPFWDSGADLLVFRLPTGPWTLSLFASADDTRFFGAHSEPSEQLVIAAAQAKRALTHGWSSTFAVNYFFQHQILDLPPSQTNQAPVSLVMGNNFTGRWMARKDFEAGWAQIELAGGRELMAAPLDSFWQSGPRLDLGYRYGTGSDLRLNYQWNYTLFDTRQQVNSQGDAIPGTALRFMTQTAELTWHKAWTDSNHWHTFVTAGYELNEDNGSGYFNYSHYRLAPRIEYRGKTWKINAVARGGYYNFPVQPVVPGNSELREKVYFTAGIHAEKQLLKSLKTFAEYTYDRSVSDLYTDTYFNDTVKLGFDWQF